MLRVTRSGVALRWRKLRTLLVWGQQQKHAGFSGLSTPPPPAILVPHLFQSGTASCWKIDGRAVAQDIKDVIAKRVIQLRDQVGAVPGLAVVQVGHHKASDLYSRSKQLACDEVGIASFAAYLPATTPEDEVLELVNVLNADDRVHGILVQLPMPPHIQLDRVLRAVSLDKDVDGLHPINLGRLVLRGLHPTFIPCTPLGCLEILRRSRVQIENKHAVVIGCSNVVGLPTALLLQRQNATVTVIHEHTPNPAEATKRADIVVSATGVAQLVRGHWLKKGAVVLDVGTSAVQDTAADGGYRLIGDVCFEEAEFVASAITPVPGGVGPVTVAMVLSNTLQSALRFFGIATDTSDNSFTTDSHLILRCK
ncbi:bifunctional protein FolD 2 isoform X2 [Physcomitrium patens]|uniref:Methenyltetrahydrofolate cyclohydrolase n=1 Tax=Physcomitrium patens TaxID=3218 RepID=A0A2K1IAT3_PHYPA|nr:bifunctional protein FolD 2-like isoform X2 [Physcomitrium patens]PNR26389.1 hypothetical protein PHYPA_030964 [Physcomitrium patens]|eukprot:XP_024367781.1 bifunctional protein FolD 2-like isoform X2 [Physcomitrella patens]